MKRKIKLYLEDIKDAINKIEKYTQKISFKKFANDQKTIDAVVRNLEIIGEAANQIPASIRKNYPDIPWSEIVDMRNKIIHEYFGVDIDILWQSLKEDIPTLKIQIRKVKES